MVLRKLNSIRVYFKLIRFRHWIKNFLIFTPSILAKNFTENYNWLYLIIGFLTFSFISSSGYILNDIRDIDKDRQHPIKKNRPLASASVKVRYSFLLSILLLTAGLGISLFLGTKPLLILLFYFLVNWLYSNVIKSIRFLDIIFLSIFYITRLFFGATIAHNELTGWFLITITSACLAFLLNKRQVECSIISHHQIPGRDYSKDDLVFLQIMAIGFGIFSLVVFNIHAYFIVLINNPFILTAMNLTAIFLILSFFNNSKIHDDDPIERILKSPANIVMSLLFLSLYFFEIYVNH